MVELPARPLFAAAAMQRPGLSLRVGDGRGHARLQLRDPARATALTPLLGFALPAFGRHAHHGAVRALSVAPGEWLVIAEPEAALAPLLAAVAQALADAVALVTAMTDALVVLDVAGDDARNVIAAHCPLDLDESVFPPGSAARSLFGETIAVITRSAAAPAFTMFIDQTAAGYAWRQLVRSGFPAQ